MLYIKENSMAHYLVIGIPTILVCIMFFVMYRINSNSTVEDKYGRTIKIKSTATYGVSYIEYVGNMYTWDTKSWKEFKELCPDYSKKIQELENEAKNRSK